jgi:L-ascorbate metabolism protein UlaG (beta-lactamase superfamily)
MARMASLMDNFTWFRQSAFLWKDADYRIYIDPWQVTTDDPADIIVITHAHFDHFSMDDIDKVRKESTQIFAPADVAKEISGNVTPVSPGESHHAGKLSIQTVPAYNIVEERLEAHPQENNWVGYILSLGKENYYHAGDTDHIKELDSVKADVAMLPIGGTYTMNASEAADLARAINPQIAVPMHYGYVVGSPPDARRFAEEAAPVKVQALTPVHPFEH